MTTQSTTDKLLTTLIAETKKNRKLLLQLRNNNTYLVSKVSNRLIQLIVVGILISIGTIVYKDLTAQAKNKFASDYLTVALALGSSVFGVYQVYKNINETKLNNPKNLYLSSEYTLEEDDD